jgi:MoxR-like ATPase
MEINRFQGNGLPPTNSSNKKRFPYLADEQLVKAVNMAIVLRRPLLVKGPPGCGKTRLAHAIAHELGLPLYEWHIKSTARARDGLYTIDMVRRLQDAQLNEPLAQRLTPYLRFGELGKALCGDGEAVLLIDEIDKADIDFPNDLLRELEEKKFVVEELDEEKLTPEEKQKGFRKTYSARNPPIIIITSNDEKELPDAFLRRCLFHYIDFPSAEELLKIVKANISELKLKEALIKHAIARLSDFRAISDLRKLPATSELIDWVRILYHWNVVPADLAKDKQLTDLPHWQALFKHERDLQRVKRYMEEQASAAEKP